MRPLLAALALALVACSDAPKLPIGGTCANDDDCSSGLCAGTTCLDPAIDSDADGLINGLEVTLGSDPNLSDSDLDGVLDSDELSPTFTNVDSDGDSLADVLESRTSDADGDCITDQFDTRNDTPDTDLSPMRAVVCSNLGICSSHSEEMRVDCSTGTARCLYDGVPGYEDPEVTCDGLDQNCDGTPDDGLADRDGDAIADCVDNDWDNDGAPDATDNCPVTANADQLDSDDDGLGNACASLYGLRFVTLPERVTAAAPFSTSVELAPTEDTAGPRPPFRGTITLSLEGDATLGGTLATPATSGLATFSDLTIDRVGETHLIARSGTLTEARAPLSVLSGEATSLAFDRLPPTITAGAPFGIDLVARDAAGNLAADYVGTVTLSTRDGRVLTAPYTFTTSDAGRHTFSDLTLTAAIPTYVKATDGTLETEVSLDITHGTASRLAILAPTTAGAPFDVSVTAGAPFDVTVTALDTFDNVVKAYTGTVASSSDDARASLPTPYTFTRNDYGSRTFPGIRLYTAGSHDLAFDDGALSGRLALNVAPSSPAEIVITAPEIIIAGEPFFLTVELRDAYGNLTEDAPVSFSVASRDDAPSVFEVDTATSTVGPLTLTTSGLAPLEITSLDLDLRSDVLLVVSPGPTSRILLALPTERQGEGVPFSGDITAVDAFGNVVTGYRGTVRFETSDPRGEVPPALTFTESDAGVRTVSGFIGRTFGVQSFTATDGLLAVTAAADIACGAPGSISLSGLPSTLTAGETTPALTVTVRDTSGDTCVGSELTLTLESSDPRLELPSISIGASGVSTLPGLTFETSGVQTLEATLPGSVSTTATLTIDAATTTSLEASLADTSIAAGVGTALTVTARDAFGNRASGYRGSVRFTSTDPLATLPPNFSFSEGDAGRKTLSNVIFKTVGSQRITVSDVATPSLTTDASIDVLQGADIVLVLSNAPSTQTAGTSFGLTLEVQDLFGNRITGYRGTVRFTSNDPSAVLPADYAFQASDAGLKSFTGLTMKTAQLTTLRVSDLATSTITTSTAVNVTPSTATSLTLVCSPTNPVAGMSISCTATALDAFSNRATGFRGTMTFSSSDSTATLPATYTFTASDLGLRTFSGLVLKKASSQTITVTSAAMTDTETLSVSPASASSFQLSGLPASVTAGTSQSLTATALDAFGNTATSFNGSATLTSTDPSATFSSPLVFAAGTRALNITFKTAGAQSVSLASGSVTGSASTSVTPAAAATLELSALPATVTAGVVQTLTATLRDAFNNVATGFTGTVSLSSSDGSAVLNPTSLAFSSVHAGTRTFDLTFKKKGAQSVTASSGTLTTTRSTTVNPAAASRLAVTGLPASVTAGANQSLVATVYDAFDNVADFNGNATLTSTDSQAVLPTPIAIASGTKSFSAALRTAGNQNITVSTGTLSATMSSTVAPASGAKLSLTGLPATVTAGTAQTLTLTVLDAYDNRATGYTGSVSLTSSDPNATLNPTSLTLIASDQGRKSFTATFVTAGTQSVTASNALGSTSSQTTVNPSSNATQLDLAALPATMNAGTSQQVSVTLKDAFGNTVTNFAGTVVFAVDAAETQGTLNPSSYTFTGTENGTTSVTVTFKTAGGRTLSAAAGSLTDASTTTVLPLNASKIEISSTDNPIVGTAFSVTIRARDTYNNLATGYRGTVKFSTNDSHPAPYTPIVPGNQTFAAADAGTKTISNGVTLYTAGSRTVTVTDTNAPALTATLSLNLPALSSGSKLRFVTQPADTTAGTTLTPSPSVEVLDLYDNRVSTNTTTIAINLLTNPGRALFTSATAISSSGLATFSNLKVDRPGSGYVLKATSGTLTAASSAPFAITWAAPTVDSVTVTNSSSNCVDVTYSVAHALAALDIRVDYALSNDGYTKWSPATQTGLRPAASTDPYGTSKLFVGSALTSRSFRWNALADLGAFSAITAKVRVTAYAGTSSASAESAAFTYDATWSANAKVRTATQNFVDSTLADLNDDGHLDLVAIAASNGNVLFFKGDGAGNFATVQSLSLGTQVSPNPWRVAVADVNADGRPDVIVSDRASPRIFVGQTSLDGTGTLTMTAVMVSGVCNASDIVEDIAIRNIDNDIYPELFLACPSSKKVSVYGYTGTAFAPENSIITAQSPYSVSVADLDWDGTQEVIIGELSGVVEIASAASFGVLENLALPTTAAIVDFAIGDIDRDGTRDLVASHATVAASPYTGGKSFIATFGLITRDAQNLVLSRFDPNSHKTITIAPAVNQVELADLDRDGWLDVIGTSTASDLVFVGRFQDARAGTLVSTTVSTGTTSTGPDALSVGDIDHDGWLDLGVSRRTTTDSNRLYALLTKARTDCDTTWSGPGEAPSYTTSLTDTVVADMDLDGRMDLVHANGGLYTSAPGGAQVVHGLGNGRFHSTVTSIFSSQLPSAASAVGDVDSDGKPDVVVIDNGKLYAYRQATATSFTALDLGITVGATRDLIVADLDLDRRDDIAFIRELNDNAFLQVYLQLGPGVFTAAATSGTALGMTTDGLDVADLDVDGRLDFGFITTVPGQNGKSLCTLLWTTGTTWETGFGRCSAIDYNSTPLTVSTIAGFSDLEVGGPNAYVYTISSLQRDIIQVRWEGTTRGVFSELEDDGNAATPIPGYSLCGIIYDLTFGELDGSPGSRDLALRCGEGSDAMKVFARVDKRFSSRGDGFGALGPDPYTMGSLAIADFDGDLRPDLLDGTRTYRHLASNGIGFGAPSGTLLGSVSEILDFAAIADFDQNGFPDAATGGSSYSTLYITLQNASATFEPPVDLPFSTSFKTEIQVADLNGDYRPDLTFGTGAASTNLGVARQFKGLSTGNYFVLNSISLGSTTPRGGQSIAVGDFDGKGLDDIAVLTSGTATANDDRLVIRLQGAGGDFLGPFTNTTDYFQDNTAVIASGRLRLVSSTNARETGIAVGGICAASARACVRVFGLTTAVTGGDTVTAVASLTPKDAYSIIGLEVADLNLDGRDDILLIQDMGGRRPLIDIFLQSATGSFTEVMTGQSSIGVFSRARIADFNRDGRPDLALLMSRSETSGETVEIRLNNGSGANVSFSDTTSLESWGEYSHILLTNDTANTGRAALTGLDGWTNLGYRKR